MLENRSNNEMILIGEEPLKPGMYRVYEFLHGYSDHSIEENDKWLADPKNDEYILFTNILNEEIKKEIKKEIIRVINDKSLSKEEN